jgi:hypothetical protein
MLPDKLFFTGAPGSRWSGIHQSISQISGVNRSDETEVRSYSHGQFSGHKGAYFGTGMEFEPYLNNEYINGAWESSAGMKIVKSHEWAYMLDDISSTFSDNWIMMIYRPTIASFQWWIQAGGFKISYPNYTYYEDALKMKEEIEKQNTAMLGFACKKSLSWSYLTSSWIEKHFGQGVEVNTQPDILVTLYKG